MVREIQDKQYGGRLTATVLNGNPDFVALAKSYGIGAAYASSNAEAKILAQKMLESDESFVLVCRVDPETPTI